MMTRRFTRLLDSLFKRMIYNHIMGKVRSFLVGKHLSLITSVDEQYWNCFVESAFLDNDTIFLRCELEDGEVNYVALDTVCNFFELPSKLRPKKNKATLLKIIK